MADFGAPKGKRLCQMRLIKATWQFDNRGWKRSVLKNKGSNRAILGRLKGEVVSNEVDEGNWAI
jgi:hypothetical protein